MGNGHAAGQSILAAIVPLILLLAFGVAAAIAPRALRLGPWSATSCWLLLGVALVASGLGNVVDSGSVEVLAELGVVFLLFDIGLHFSFRHVREQAGGTPPRRSRCGRRFLQRNHIRRREWGQNYGFRAHSKFLFDLSC